MILRRHCRIVVIVIILAGLVPTAASAQSGTWSNAAAGTYNWSTVTNWQSGVVADGANNTANFTTAGLTGNITVTLDTARTLGALVFNNPSNSFAWTVSGPNALTLSSAAAGGPSIAVNNSTPATVAVPLAGTQGLTKNGEGTLNLSGTNTYSGGTTVNDGTLAVTSDANLGSGTVTVGALGTVNFLSTATTSHTFNLSSGGTVAANAGAVVTLNVGSLASGYLDGSGTFTTAAAGVVFTNMTNAQSTTTISASPSDQLVSLTNDGALMVAANLHSTEPATFTALFNQGSGSVTFGAASHTNISGLQSFGVVTINPTVVGSGLYTLLTNTGATALNFNGGSRTFVGTLATVGPGNNPSFVAGIDLHGQNIHITGGLFVNNGFLADTVGGGSVIVDAGALFKGSGFTGVAVVTENGGRVQAGNSPGTASFASLSIGPGGINNFLWQINDAVSPGGINQTTLVSGWGQLQANKVTIPNQGASTGNLSWTATSTPGRQFQVALETLINPTPAGSDNPGPMADFDPTKSYVWPVINYQGTYAGPTDSATLTADTLFDTSQFQNPIDGTFSMAFDPANQSIDIVYTPVPEPGTLMLVGLSAAALVWRRRFSRVRV